MEAREALIQLNLVRGLGSVTIHRLLSAFGSAEHVFQAAPAGLKEVLGRFGTEEVAAGIRSASLGKALAGEIQEAQRLRVRIITFLDPDYPELLKEIPDPPPVLYVKGDLLKEDEAAVAMVGTRAASPYGLGTARQLAQDLARCGITVVSGLAEGIDGAAHEGALEGKGRTLAVLGHGLKTLFPSHHEKLARRILGAGALISEFPMDWQPTRDSFPRRNRVIAGLSLGVVVVEAPIQSGALITAREALEQGREVFAVPGPVSSTRNRGAHRLIQDGAKLVEDAQDILEELVPALKERFIGWPGANAAGHPSAPGLSEEELKVYEAIPVGEASMTEWIGQKTDLNPSSLLSVLTRLEMKGLIKQVLGQGYSRER